MLLCSLVFKELVKPLLALSMLTTILKKDGGSAWSALTRLELALSNNLSKTQLKSNAHSSVIEMRPIQSRLLRKVWPFSVNKNTKLSLWIHLVVTSKRHFFLMK